MEYYLISLIGLVYYVIVYFLSKKFNFKIIHGLWIPVFINLIVIGLLVYSSYTDSTGWASLGYFVMLILSLGILLVYLTSWALHSIITYYRKRQANN